MLKSERDFVGDLGVHRSVLLTWILEFVTSVQNQLRYCFFTFFGHAPLCLWFKISYCPSLSVKLFFSYLSSYKNCYKFLFSLHKLWIKLSPIGKAGWKANLSWMVVIVTVILTTVNKSVLIKIKDNKIVLALCMLKTLSSLAAMCLKIILRIWLIKPIIWRVS
jgi:hypothetical protein